MIGVLPSIGLVKALHLRLTEYGLIEVAVGVVIDVGGPQVKTERVLETGPNPTVFIAVTLKHILVLDAKLPPVVIV